MKHNELFRKYPELIEIINLIRSEFVQSKRPANEVIMDDVDLMEKLKVSKRTIATWRQKRIIKCAKIEGRYYYMLSDVLEMLEKKSIQSIDKSLKVKK